MFLDLVAGGGQKLVRPGLRLGQQLAGVPRRGGHQLPRALLGLPPGLPGLRAGPRRPLLSHRGPLLGIGDQLLRGRPRPREPLRLVPLGFLTPGRELDVELGLGPSLLRVALLQDLLRLAAHLIRVPPGGGEDLIPLPLARRHELCDLPLGGGAELGDLPPGRGPRPGQLMVGHGTQRGDLPPGRRGYPGGRPAGGRPDSLGLPPGQAAQVPGLPLGAGPQRGHLVPGRGAQLAGIRPGRRLQLADCRAGLPQDLGGLLLSEPQQPLDPRTKLSGGGPLQLPQPPAGLGQLAPRGPGLLVVLAGLVLQLPDVLLDLTAVIATHHHAERPQRRIPKDATGRGINAGLHPRHHPLPSQAGDTSASATVCPRPAGRPAESKTPGNPTALVCGGPAAGYRPPSGFPRPARAPHRPPTAGGPPAGW